MFHVWYGWRVDTHTLIVLFLQNIHSCRVRVVMFEYIMVQVWVWLYDIYIYIYILYDYTCKWQKMSIRVKSNKASGKVSKLLILNIKWKNIFSLFLESMAVNFIYITLLNWRWPPSSLLDHDSVNLRTELHLTIFFGVLGPERKQWSELFACSAYRPSKWFLELEVADCMK